ncbi:type 1 glutamine amidotransferase domain-containing protein [Halobacillus litoralis]|uniref:Type 1 glutamine amidotransferase domain-containing protein n=1 Tax=Halobacillus litoralis TaxID=45668 RepID=A0A410MES8_9BACI|nr:type 1 glutamine amidotransferase domain-containing protein [Halobacillus litoralis]QAS53244.1 type 1 glutamine amidotransferase domain-containing protein [Halobacillus litoralis]
MAKKILMIVTNVDQMDKDNATGLWLSEFVEPSTEFQQAGYEVIASSPKGGRIPIDPNSYSNELPRVWDGVMEPIHDTVPLSKVDPTDFAAIFLCGGHGTMYDFPENEQLQDLLRHFLTEEKIIGSVCHGPAGFVGVVDHNSRPILNGKKITGFTNEEEQQTGLESVVPFMLEDQLREAGADFDAGEAFKDHVVVDAPFVTGQNPQSSLSTAQKVIEQLKNR